MAAIDLGNVCLRVNPDHCAQALGYADTNEIAAVYPAVQKLVNRMNRGQLAPDTFFADLAANLPGLTTDRARRAWIEVLGPEIEGMKSVIGEILAAHVRPVFFSDTCPTHYAHIIATLSFADRVPGAVLSFRVGALKPEPAMFVAMEKTWCGGNVPLFYTDDLEENVAAAHSRGWHAHLFRDVPGCLHAFRNRLHTFRTEHR